MPDPRAASPGKGAMAIGMRGAPAPVISIESCATASGAVSRSTAPRTARVSKACILGCSLQNGDYRHPPLLFVLRPEAKFQLPLEEVGLLGLGQRRRLQDGALHGIVVALVPARLAQADAEHFAGRQLGHIEDRLRIAAHVARQADVAADLRADLVHPGGERTVAS